MRRIPAKVTSGALAVSCRATARGIERILGQGANVAAGDGVEGLAGSNLPAETMLGTLASAHGDVGATSTAIATSFSKIS